MSDFASRSEAALRALTRTYRQVHYKRRAGQAAVDLEATEETVPARRLRRRTLQTRRSTKRLNGRRAADTVRGSEGYGPKKDHQTSSG